jgi:predicted ATP-grasp superfamily ATP-dependent carboligase
VPVPRETLVTRPEEGACVAAKFALPLVLKPRASFDARNPSAKQMVRKAYTWEDFDRSLGEMLARGPVVVQEHLLGAGVGVELLVHAGAPLMAFQHMRVHEPLEGGGSSYRQSVVVEPQLLDAARRILRPLAYTGVAMVEFKINSQTGEWALMEVNGRF